LCHQGWVGEHAWQIEWVTISAPNRGADFSSGAGGLFLRERFGYEPSKSRSWRLITQYSMTSASQSEMFYRIRRATDWSTDTYGLREDWEASVERVARIVREQAPICGLAGMSEGATVAAILLAQHTLGKVDLGLYNPALLTFCALTSPAHAELYREVGMMSSSQSLHLVGSADTRDIQHMVGRTAALYGAGSGVKYFAGGHKLPKADNLLTRFRMGFSFGCLGYSKATSPPTRSRLEGH